MSAVSVMLSTRVLRSALASPTASSAGEAQQKKAGASSNSSSRKKTAIKSELGTSTKKASRRASTGGSLKAENKRKALELKDGATKKQRKGIRRASTLKAAMRSSSAGLRPQSRLVECP